MAPLPQHSGTLIRLQTLLHRLKGFHALIAQHNQPLYRDGLIDFLSTAHPASKALDLKQGSSFRDFELSLESLAETTVPIHLINLESLELEQRQEFFRGINYHREYIARVAKGTLIFWLPEPLVRDMALDAADFWAWREQVLDFNRPLEQPERLQNPWGKIINLDSPSKRARIKEIEAFLHTQTAQTTLSQADLKRELGRLYWSVGDYTQAREYLKAAITDYGHLDEAHAQAISLRDLAEILDTQGERETALRLLRTKILPVYEQLGDVHEKAVTMGKIAGILQSCGQLDEALRIRQQDELPVYEQLGDVRALLVGRTKLAKLLWQMDAESNALKIQELLSLALTDARRLQLPEAEGIEGWMEQMGLALTKPSSLPGDAVANPTG